MVKPKKHLGQHFLADKNIAAKIVAAMPESTGNILEIGPGTGVLTKILIENPALKLNVVEIDVESVTYLTKEKILERDHIFQEDFLKMDLSKIYDNQQFDIIGNFPYNISSQILFKMLDDRMLIPSLTGMFQKEVAERVVSPEGSKDYGILSVMVQAYYRAEYLFTVSPGVFIPPPKVQSGVIRLIRREFADFGCDEILFKKIVKQSFNTRRKMLRGSLRDMIRNQSLIENPIFEKRPEQLNVDEFKTLTNLIKNQ